MSACARAGLCVCVGGGGGEGFYRFFLNRMYV